MGVSTKYGFGLYREINKIKPKYDEGLTKYGIEFNKEIQGFGVEKSWDLDIIKK